MFGARLLQEEEVKNQELVIALLLGAEGVWAMPQMPL